MTLVVPAGIIQDWMKADSFNRNPALYGFYDFVADMAQPFWPTLKRLYAIDRSINLLALTPTPETCGDA